MCFAPLSFAPHLCALLEEASFQKHEVEVLETFHLDTCFAPQPRALFPHRNFETCSDVGVFWACSCRHVLRATTACIVSSFFSPDGSAPNHGFHQRKSGSESSERAYLSTLRSHKTLRKNSVSRHFYLFANRDLLSTDSFSSDSFSSLAALTTVAASLHKSEVLLVNDIMVYYIMCCVIGL